MVTQESTVEQAIQNVGSVEIKEACDKTRVTEQTRYNYEGRQSMVSKVTQEENEIKQVQQTETVDRGQGIKLPKGQGQQQHER